MAPAIGRGAGGGSGATGAASLLIQIAGLPTLETKQLPGRSSVPIEKICTVRLSLYDDLIIVQVQHLEATLAKGTVKWFNQKKGYGFIQPVGGGRDVFVHITAVERAGLSTLNEGQTVEYEEVASKGKTSAENLKVAR